MIIHNRPAYSDDTAFIYEQDYNEVLVSYSSQATLHLYIPDAPSNFDISINELYADYNLKQYNDTSKGTNYILTVQHPANNNTYNNDIKLNIDIIADEETYSLVHRWQQSGHTTSPYINVTGISTKINNTYFPLARDKYGRYILKGSYTNLHISYDANYMGEVIVDALSMTRLYGDGLLYIVREITAGYMDIELDIQSPDATTRQEDSLAISFTDTQLGSTSYILNFVLGIPERPQLSDDARSNEIQIAAGTSISWHLFYDTSYDFDYVCDVEWVTVTNHVDNATQSTVTVTVGQNTGQSRIAHLHLFIETPDGGTNSIQYIIPQASTYYPYIKDIRDMHTWVNGSSSISMPVIRRRWDGTFLTTNVKIANWSNVTEYQIYKVLANSYTNMITIAYAANGQDGVIMTNMPKTENEESDLVDIYRIDLKTSSSTNTYNIYFAIIQQGISKISSMPIWCDEKYATNKRYFRFRDMNTGSILYNGRTYNNASNVIEVSHILRNFINIDKYPFENDITANNLFINVCLELSDTSSFDNYEAAAVYRPFWNYSYNYNDYGLDNGYDHMWEANPIRYYDSRQIVPVSFACPYDNIYHDAATIVDDDNSTIFNIQGSLLRNDMFTICIRPQSNNILKYICDDDESIIATQQCNKGDYCVYYLNTLGSWCWMLFKGKQMESTKLSQTYYLKDKDASKPYNIQNAVYDNSIDEYYSLTTGYLTDEQSRLLKDMYISPCIYVHELDNNIIYSVNLDTMAYDIKTHANQGRKLFTHTIKLTKSMAKNISI